MIIKTIISFFVSMSFAAAKQADDNAASRKPNVKPAGAKRVYKRPSDEEIKKMLTKEQFRITQKDGTERAFKNEYWDNKEDGIYVDVVTGEPLFSSTHKYKSGTGWPSFYQTIEEDVLIHKEDRGLFSIRTEVRSKIADSHLGHVFDDGPQPTGKRFCINSGALRFIPKSKMADEGYGDYLKLFEKKK